jgi:DNA-directed RNA polymerase specialized sigma subunit
VGEKDIQDSGTRDEASRDSKSNGGYHCFEVAHKYSRRGADRNRPTAPPQGTKHSLTLEDWRLVIENLPAVRVATRRIFRSLPGQVSFARIYSAGVMGLVGALDEFHASNLVPFADSVKLKIRDAILYSGPDLVWEAEEQRRKGSSIEAAIHELRAMLDRSPAEVEISHELHMREIRLSGSMSGM